MGCLLWGPCSDVIHQPEFELTGVTPCIALMGEQWDVCCKDHVEMQYNNSTLNSQGTPHVSPLWSVFCEDHVVMRYINQNLNTQRSPHVSPLRTRH